MNELTFRPKQSLGQNFLVDENIARKIIINLTPNFQDVIIEIGPGFGVLTKYLVDKVKRIIAVEIDRKLCQGLKAEFGKFTNFELVEGDFLKFDITRYLQKEDGIRILGNIPYHITSPVLFKIFDVREFIADMTLMIQREVAERIVSPPGRKSYGVLSIFSQLYSQPKILFHVSRNVFRPKPDVDSTVLRFDFSRAPEVEIGNEKFLSDIIHVAFQQRRKMLRKSLRQVPGFAEVAGALDFDLERRPEQLSKFEFVKLSDDLSALWKK